MPLDLIDRGAPLTDQPMRFARKIGGRWFAPGSLNKVAISDDGEAWSSRPMNTAGNLTVKGMAGDGAGRIVLVGLSTSVVISTDNGETWAEHADVLPYDVRAVAQGASVFVAARSGGLYSSPTGEVWTLRDNTINANDVAHDGEQFVAVGTSGAIRTSPDGLNWTPRTSGAGTSSLIRIRKVGPRWLAMGFGRVTTSLDGESWSHTNLATTTELFDADYHEGTWALIARAALVYTSTTGTSWTERTTGLAGNATRYGLRWIGNQWMCGSLNEDWALSPTAASWTKQAPNLPGALWDVQYVDEQVVMLIGDNVWSSSPPAPTRIELPLTIDVLDPAGRIVLPLRVQVAQPGSVTLPLTLDVLDPAVLAGLDGAGGWAAAPDGLWAAVVVLDGADISARIQGTVRVEREDDAAATATFSFLPAGPIAAMGLIGRTVRIAFSQASGINVQAMFSGVVAVPSIDAATGLVSCECTDQMPEVFAAADRAWIDSAIGGRYHVAVSGEPTDNWEYALERLQSVPRSIALDVQQRPVVLPWRDMPRTMTIRTPDMIDETLQVALPDRDSMRTRITVRMQYRYWRLRGRGAVAAWAQPFAFFASYDLVIGFRERLWLLRSMVEGASERLPGWTLRGPVVMEHPEPGLYFASPPAFYGYGIDPEVAVGLVSGFRGYYTARWTQVVTETYEITLVSPQLEAALGGPIAEEMGANLDAGDLPEGWTADETVQPVLVIPAVGDVSLAWQPAEGDTTQRDEVLRTLLDRAWVRRWSASRSGRVSFGMALRPDIWLDVWAEVVHDADDMDVTLNAAGKVTRIEHELDAETGVARTHVEVAVGMPGNVAASLPEWELPAVEMPDETRPLTAYSLDVPTFVGGEPTSPPWDPETMVGFATNLVGVGEPDESTYHYYPHQLALRAPDIDALDRDPLEVLVQAQIEGESPTDLLEIDPS